MGMVEDWYDEEEAQEKRAAVWRKEQAEEGARHAEQNRLLFKLLLCLPFWFAAIAFYGWTELTGTRPFGGPDASPEMQGFANLIHGFGMFGALVFGAGIAAFVLVWVGLRLWHRRQSRSAPPAAGSPPFP